MHRKIEDVQPVLVQLIDHEANHSLRVLGHHADAVPLAEAANKIVLRPGKLEAALLDLVDLGHIPPDHPADMDAQRLLRLGVHRQALPAHHVPGYVRTPSWRLAPWEAK